ncbi:MAG: Hpt domain-containing protein [Chryseotalea sp.]|jgi:chemotaxis protein histidine kinase CheA|nr:Hpt domain-containing protein [Flammeovirgaceae bacterium]
MLPAFDYWLFTIDKLFTSKKVVFFFGTGFDHLAQNLITMKQQTFLYLDEERLNEQSLNNRHMREELVNTFLLHFPNLITRAEKALLQKDGNSLARAFHSLKASMGLFGATDVQTQTAQAEKMAMDIYSNESLLTVHIALAKAKELVKEVEVLKEKTKS